MIPIVCIVGRSKSGKTVLIERLIPELNRRGLRVATVKHHHGDFEIDQKGKDSWRHRAAGAHTAVISSPQKVALVADVAQDLPLEEVVERYIREVDIVIAEGYKGGDHPKIEVFRKAIHPEPLAPTLKNLIAVVGDPVTTQVPSLPFDDIQGLVALILRVTCRG